MFFVEASHSVNKHVMPNLTFGYRVERVIKVAKLISLLVLEQLCNCMKLMVRMLVQAMT